MECSKIKALLSEYIDGVLDGKTKAHVEKHLSGCRNCMTELNSLKKMVEELGVLESHEAPEDFLEKLHERIEAEGKFRKVFRTLFVPGRIKIPLEFATAAAMAVLIFAILNIQHPEKKLLDAPERSTDTRVAEKVSIDATTHSRKKDLQGAKPVVEETTAAEPAEKREIIQLALLLKTEELRQSYAPRAAVVDEPIPERIVESQRAAKSAAPSTARKKEAWREEKRGMGSATKEQDTLESPLDDVRVYSDKVVSRVKALIGETNGRMILVEYEKQSGVPNFIQLEIPVQHYKSFLAELAKISILQEPPPPISEKDKEWVQIRIRFITPK